MKRSKERETLIDDYWALKIVVQERAHEIPGKLISDQLVDWTIFSPESFYGACVEGFLEAAATIVQNSDIEPEKLADLFEKIKQRRFRETPGSGGGGLG